MEEFKISKSHESTVMKTIRFPEDLHDTIVDIVENANKGKKKKEYSFNGVVCSACTFALKHLSKEFKIDD